MQDQEDQDLNYLSADTMQRAIEAVKARAWDINPFTVADELKVSRSAVYRHAEIMKLIIAARGGGFGMDLRTSLDLTWQLRQLEQQNNELKEQLAVTGSHKANGLIKLADEIGANLATAQEKKNDKAEEVIFNLADNGPEMSDYLNQLACLSWKDIETVYYFRVSSLKDYAKQLFSIDEEPRPANGDKIKHVSNKKSAISYNSLASLEAVKRNKQISSLSPFAHLKSASSASSQRQKDPDLVQSAKEPALTNMSAQAAPTAGEFLPNAAQKVRQEAIDLLTEDLITNQPIIEPEKPIGEFATEIPRLIAEMHRDLASTIRADLVDQSSEIASQLAQSEPVETKLPEARNKIEAEIKLIPLFKDEPATQQSSSLSIQKQTDTGDLELIKERSDRGPEEQPASAPDELRDLIQSYIRNAVEQMAEFSHGQSIGTGKEFEVWLNNPARSKFVGSTKTPSSSDVEEEEPKKEASQPPFKPRVVPPDVRKSCLILGVRPDNITYEGVQESWKKAIAAPGVHPDLGGDTELAVYLNTAKDVLMRFLDAQAPKLGKKFGPNKVEKDSKTKTGKPKTDKSRTDKSKDEQ